MNAVELISDMAGRGVSLEAAPGGKLRYSPKNKLNSDDVARLKACKNSILNILKSTASPLSPPSPLPPTPARNGESSGDRYGDTSQHLAVTAVTEDGDQPEFVRKRYEQASVVGLVAKWSAEFGYVSLHDPTSGEWHDLRTKEAPDWAKWEASKRKELYKDGDRKAYRLTSSEMEKLWGEEHPDDPFVETDATDERGYLYADYLEED
jgi:hypothetical protein